MDVFSQDLLRLWGLTAVAWEDEPRSCSILVWFVEHWWQHGLAPRRVRLYPDPGDWRTQIWRAWAEHIILGENLDYHLVAPRPPATDPTVAAHVILLQRSVAHWVSSLITSTGTDPPAGDATARNHDA